MKLKTSCFKTALKKDMTRFAPVWGLYTLCLLLGLLLMADNGLEIGLPRAMASCIQIMSPVNLCYGLLTAQLLFGDLYTGRLCFGLHTLPLRREGWFAAHVISGLLFSLIPTAVMTAVALPLVNLSVMENGWQIPLWWLLAANGQYLFFFAVGVFSVILSGNRFGGALLYALFQLGAMLAYYIADVIYVPMLFGLVISEKVFVRFCPVVQLVEYTFLETRQNTTVFVNGVPGASWGEFWLTDNWWYLGACAAVAAVVLAVSLLCYRRRNLERAGDLMASKKLEGVFLVLYSICAAALLQMVVTAFIGYKNNYICLFIGLAVGFATGRMLLKRSTRVFSGKALLGFAVLAAAVAGSLYLTELDPLGLETRIPEAEQVESVTVRNYLYERNCVTLTEEAEIGQIRLVHAAGIEAGMESEGLRYRGEVVSGRDIPEDADWSEVERSASVVLTYRLKNGREMTRIYYIWGWSDEAELAKKYLSRFPAVFGVEEPRYGTVNDFTLNGFQVPVEYTTREEIELLLEALTLDSQAGTLAQDYAYHPWDTILEFEYYGEIQREQTLWLHIKLGDTRYTCSIFPDSEHTLAWIRERGLDSAIEGSARK